MQDLREALAVITSMEQRLNALQHDVQNKNETIKQLKKRHHHRVHFDEATIAEHDKERGTRMKIDEPKTPYVRDEPLAFPDAADGEEEQIPVINDARFAVGMNKPDVSKSVQVGKVEEVEEDDDDEDYEPVIELPPLPVSQAPQPRRPLQLDIQAVNQSLDDQKKSDFEKHRAKHYNEMERLRQWRNSRANKGAEDDEDEDEDEEDASSHNVVEDDDQEDNEGGEDN